MNEAFDINVLKRLFRELWLQSNNCTQPISSIWFSVNEVASCSQKTSLEIKNYLNFLIENKVIQNTSKEPLLHEFTAFGKKIFRTNQLLLKISQGYLSSPTFFLYLKNIFLKVTFHSQLEIFKFKNQ